MAGLADILRDGIALVNDITKTLQVTITLAPYIGPSSRGMDTHDTPVPYEVILDLNARQRKLSDGAIVQQRASIQFLTAVAPKTGIADRQNPIDPRDKIVLPDGTTGPILGIMGVEDPDVGGAYAAEVILG